MKAVILAGGLGTRMGNSCENLPKPMMNVCGKPVLEHQIEVLKKEGISQFVFVVCHMSEKIEKHFGDGNRFGIEISYFHEHEPLGTAGALFELNLTEDFLLCNGDLVFDFCLKDMVDFHHKNNALATLFTHPNSHPYDSTLICTDENGCITNLASSKDFSGKSQNLCNAGIQIVSPDLLKICKVDGKANFDRDIIKPAIPTRRIFSYKSSEYVHDMGTPDRLRRVEEDFSLGIVKNKHRKHTQKAVFLDRDGTINVHKGFLTDPDEIELIEGAAEAIKAFNHLGYLTIIVTNQAVIARGECTVERLKEIHNRLEMLLGKDGAFVDAIYYCPHHTDKGYAGEIAELKIQCECRKPAPGMLLKAKKDFNIELSSSYMVGDSEIDIECAKNAGCTPILIGKNAELEKVKSFNSLNEFSEYLKRK